jgi:hypothetical protein
MKDYINFTGHFKIEAVNIHTGVIVEEENKNLIMDSARASMAKIFSNLTYSPLPFINRIVVGTRGHQYDTSPYNIETNITTEKTSVQGYVKERDRLFSEFVTVTSGVTVLAVLNKGDVIFNDTVDGSAAIGYYEYTGTSTTAYSVTESELTGSDWFFIHASVTPYAVFANFTMPGTTSSGGDFSTITDENDSNSSGSTGMTVKVEQNSSSVTFYIVLPSDVGNDQFTSSSIFTEAALYAGDTEIFSLKTFKAKVKDSSVEFRITWTIEF